MRFLVNTNVLLYAANEAAPEHAKARAALASWLLGPSPFCLSWNVVYEFLRVATHPKVFRKPLRSRQAMGFLEPLVESDLVCVLAPTDRHASVLALTLGEHPRLAGNVLHDLQTAVLLREHGVGEIMTADHDFRQFPFLKVTDPTR